MNIISVYADGGCIMKNPSPYGGTWAWVAVNENNEVAKTASGMITEISAPMPISNNVSELIALILGLEAMEPGWSGTAYSDSLITIGRIFENYAMNGIPDDWKKRAHHCTRRLGTVKPVLLQGHPTKAELRAQVGRKGYPVSEFNVMCDEMCREESALFLLRAGAE